MYSDTSKISPMAAMHTKFRNSARNNGNNRYLTSARNQFLSFVKGSWGQKPLLNILNEAGYKVKSNKGMTTATKGKYKVTYMLGEPMKAVVDFN